PHSMKSTLVPDTTRFRSNTYEIEKAKHYSRVENSALPFDTINFNVVKSNSIDDDCFEYRNIENTVCTKFITQSEYESSWREVSQYVNLGKGIYYVDNVIISIIKEIGRSSCSERVY